MTWQFMSRTRTVLSVLILVVAIGLMVYLYWLKLKSPNRPDPTLPYLVAASFALMGLFGATRGGGRLETGSRILVRWKGLLVPIANRRIPFDQIERVILSPGLRPGNIQAARPHNYSFNVAVKSSSGLLLVVRWMHNPVDAQRFAKQLAEAIGTSLESRI